MFRHGLTLFLSLLLFLAFCVFLTYGKLQGVDQYVGALTLSQSIYAQTFFDVLKEQFATPSKTILVAALILSPLLASFISKKNRLFDLFIYLPMLAIIAYLALGYQVRFSRELSERILIVWVAWFGYGVFIFLLSCGILCYRKVFKKERKPSKSKVKRTIAKKGDKVPLEK